MMGEFELRLDLKYTSAETAERRAYRNQELKDVEIKLRLSHLCLSQLRDDSINYSLLASRMILDGIPDDAMVYVGSNVIYHEIKYKNVRYRSARNEFIKIKDKL